MGRFSATAGNNGGTHEVAPAGAHPAVVVGLIDLGTHRDEYQGRTYDTRKVLFAWELTHETKGDGTPYVVLQDYNWADKLAGKSKLRSLLEGWRGKPYAEGEAIDLGPILGKPCLLTVGQKTSKNGKDCNVINSVSPLPKGMPAPKPHNMLFSWHFDDGLSALEIPDWLPYLYGRPVDEKIREAHEATGGPPSHPTSHANGNGVPVGAGVGVGKGEAADEEDIIPF